MYLVILQRTYSLGVARGGWKDQVNPRRYERDLDGAVVYLESIHKGTLFCYIPMQIVLF